MLNLIKKICGKYLGLSYVKAYRAKNATMYLVNVDFDKDIVDDGWSKIDTLNDIAEMFNQKLSEGGFGNSLATITYNTDRNFYGIEIFKNKSDFDNSSVRNALILKRLKK